MRLYETLHNCLQGLLHRQPDHVMDINEALLGPQQFGAEGWCVPDLIELFEQTSPALLREQACLVMDGQEVSIYLLSRSDEIPAFSIHCRGNIPPCKGTIAQRERILYSSVGV